MPIDILQRGSERIENADAEHMMDFAIKLINRSHSIRNRNTIMNERLAILHLDHGTELLMKAYLLKEGYIINKISQSKINKGIKKGSLIEKYINGDKTIDFIEVLNIVSKKIRLSNGAKKNIESFHNLRNVIQHKALDIPLDKTERIEAFRPQLKELYEKMFPELITIGRDMDTGEVLTLHNRRRRMF